MKRNVLLSVLLVMLAFLVKAQPVTITPPSANILPGESVTLTASGATYYQWTPATGLSVTDQPETVASPSVTTTYTCRGLGPGAESVVNGDFELGNTGFTSAYEYNSNLWNEGTYYVDNDASLHHENFVGHGHGGSGNFMMVNGSTSPGTNVWTEQISVQPNQTYAFSTWVCTLAGQSNEVALLQFSINGNQIGDVFSAPPSTNIWERFYQLWNSGNSTTATITILNQNTVGSGNDFGLDDISFCQLVVLGEPQCTVYVGSMSATATADDTELCEGQSTTLHALPSGGSGNYSYSWTPANSLNNPNIQHPVATPPLGTTTYTCHVTDNSWGSAQNVSVSVVVHPNEETHEYDTICQGDSYDWHGQLVSTPNIYPYHTQTQFGCEKIVYLHLSNWETYETHITRHFCQGESYDFNGHQLSAPGIYYDTLESVHFCDSVIRLNLIQDSIREKELWESTCEGGPGYLYDDGQYYQPRPEPYIFLYETTAGCDSTVILHIDEAEYNSKTYNVSLCAEQYTWSSNGNTYYESGIYYDTLSFVGSCDSTIILDLTLLRSTDTMVNVTRCDSYHWVSDYFNVDKWFYESHYETYDFSNENGCPSHVTLNLIINDSVSYEQPPEDTLHVYYEGVIGCDSARWDERWYTADGPHKWKYQTQLGCDSTVFFPLELEYTPSPYEISPVDYNNTAPHWVITATEFQINRYDFCISEKDHPTCDWDSINWHFVKMNDGEWVDDPSVQWVLEEDATTTPTPDMICRMYVLNFLPDTIWLAATVYNKCAPQGISKRYWFVCSFYDVEEHAVDAKVYPNPTQGTISIEADNIEQVRVVDMLGQVVENQRCKRDSNVTLDLGHLSPSIYLLEIKTLDGVIKRRIVLNK